MPQPPAEVTEEVSEEIVVREEILTEGAWKKVVKTVEKWLSKATISKWRIWK